MDDAGPGLEGGPTTLRDSVRGSTTGRGAGLAATRMKESEQERFWDGGSAPKPPRFFALRQDSWPERRAALALSESRPLSRRSGCVSAEPYPPLRSVQSIRDTMERKIRTFTQNT